ncbi:LysR substrate binding domain protein [Grimontia celer]|uniref:LysR substrate binding domain protein n=2 Tax=Grimontia celer TaxID=1796497 RepID=A0A128EVA5_9GAMM|nr:LysR substrate binding domain protein [Grimontia celer]
MISLEQIQSFLSVYEAGSYSAGGRKIGKDRTTVRERVVAMEEMIGEPLFTIEGKRALPTALADALYRRAWNINKQAMDFNQAAFTANQVQLTELVIHHHALTSIDMLSDVDKTIGERYPHLKINWLQRHRDESFVDLEKGRGHISIMPSIGNALLQRDVGSVNLGADRIAVYAGKHSPLAKKKSVDVNALTTEVQLVNESAQSAHLAYMNVASQQHTVSNSELLMSLLRSRGWTALSRANAEKYVQRGEIVELNVEQLTNGYSAGLVLFYALAFENNDVVREAIRIIQEAALKHFS